MIGYAACEKFRAADCGRLRRSNSGCCSSRRRAAPNVPSRMKHPEKPIIHILLACVWLAGCGGEPIPPAPPLPVTVQAAVTAGSGARGAYSANVIADVQVDLAFKVNGYVQSILQVKGADGRMRNVQAGDLVSAGVVLATLKDETYRQSLLRAKSELENVRATLVKAKA